MRAKDFVSVAVQRVAENKTATQVQEALAALSKLATPAGLAAARKVGTAATKGAETVGTGLSQKIAQKNADNLAKAVLKKGGSLPIPADKPGTLPQEFKVDNVQGDEVTLTNPAPKPGEPVKTVHKRKDLDPLIQNMANSNASK